MDKTIITISRQYGSGGHIIGKKLSEELDIPFYDNEIISISAKKSGIRANYFKSAEEIPANNFLYSLSMLSPSSKIYGMPLSDKIFYTQAKVILEIAHKDSCVIIGRCADYILKDFENCIHIFISASFPNRVKRAVAEYHIPMEGAEKKVLKTDKNRETYYNYHTDLKWGLPSNYDLVVNTDPIGIDNTVTFIKTYVALRQNMA